MGEGRLQISLNTTGFRAWYIEIYVVGQMVCCLSWIGIVSELFEGPPVFNHMGINLYISNSITYIYTRF